MEHAQKRYLRELLLLALRVSALLLLAFAFARPFLERVSEREGAANQILIAQYPFVAVHENRPLGAEAAPGFEQRTEQGSSCVCRVIGVPRISQARMPFSSCKA